MNPKALEIKISGAVQGVGFRYAAVRKAKELGVAGWARNDPDGGVSILVEGEAENVDEFVDWCRHGPAFASVARVEVKNVPASGLKDFL